MWYDYIENRLFTMKNFRFKSGVRNTRQDAGGASLNKGAAPYFGRANL